MSHALNQLEIVKRFAIQKSIRIYSNDFIEKRKKSKKTEIMNTLAVKASVYNFHFFKSR